MIEAADGIRRKAPEYLNIRQELTRDGSGQFVRNDLNLLPEQQFAQKLAAGNYDAAHFIDDTCDGAITVRVQGLNQSRRDRAAYSLVTAPDYFPLCDQTELARWEKTLPRRAANSRLNDHFAQGGPDPLSNERLAANPTLVRGEDPTKKAFSRRDKTITAIVGSAAASQQPKPSRPNTMVSYLSDGAAGVFAPGWDVSRDGDGANPENDFFAAYGLGSPFPEDAKLCAALNSFWPAAAPDVARTFGNQLAGRRTTAMPLLDEELGFHPRHQKVLQGEVQSRPGWDGEFGPFFEDNGQMVNYLSGDRSDYVVNALNGHLVVTPFVRIDAHELICRMMALRGCIANVPPAGDRVFNSILLLVTAEAVEDWRDRPDRAGPNLVGRGYLYVFAEMSGTEQPTEELNRRRRQVARQIFCQIANARLAFAVRLPPQPREPFTEVEIPPLGF
jgi:hypothetical protein